LDNHKLLYDKRGAQQTLNRKNKTRKHYFWDTVETNIISILLGFSFILGYITYQWEPIQKGNILSLMGLFGIIIFMILVAIVLKRFFNNKDYLEFYVSDILIDEEKIYLQNSENQVEWEYYFKDIFKFYLNPDKKFTRFSSYTLLMKNNIAKKVRIGFISKELVTDKEAFINIIKQKNIEIMQDPFTHEDWKKWNNHTLTGDQVPPV
jgi:hypothetical protein